MSLTAASILRMGRLCLVVDLPPAILLGRHDFPLAVSNFEIAVLFTILTVLYLAGRWLHWRRQNARATGLYRERLAHPDFAAVEAHFGVGLPSELKAFYNQPLAEKSTVLLLESGEWDIAGFEVINGDSVELAFQGCESYVAIAQDGCGNQYLFDPRNPKGGVFFKDHVTGVQSPVSESVPSFLRAIERSGGWKK